MSDSLEKWIAEARAWANGDGCFNDDPEGEPLLCVYWAQKPFLAKLDRLESLARQHREELEFQEYEFAVLCCDEWQAGGSADTLEAVQREAMRYAMQYANDGPVTIEYYERRKLTTSTAALAQQANKEQPPNA